VGGESLMNSEKLEEYLEVYQLHKEQRGLIPTKEDILLEIIQVYLDSTTKSDKKRSAKLIMKSKVKLKEYDFWKFLNEEEIEYRLR
jgi:hypothetical protein